MQHDFDITNASGATFRADLNSALKALASFSSGSSEPTTTYAYQYWIDTSGASPILKIRNAANNAWITIGDASLANLGMLLLTGGTLSGALLSSNTDHWKIPVGTTAQRSESPAVGMIRYNSDLSSFEGYRSGSWSPLGGGGGGGSLQWIESDNAPSPSIDSMGNRVFGFQSALAQSLYTSIKVPQGFTAGSPINLYVPFYSPDASGNCLFKTVTTLIRPGTSAYTSTINQRTSTNSAVTLGAGTQNIPQMVDFDITDSTGKINSVAVAAGDIIYINISRSTDTATSDAQLLAYIAELTFS